MVSILLVFPFISDGLNKLEVVTDHGIEGAYGPNFADVTEDLDFFEISNSISDYKTDNPEIANIARSKASTVKTKLDTSALFHSRTMNPEGPCTDFLISKDTLKIQVLTQLISEKA